MSDCETCPSKNNCNTEASSCNIKNNPHNKVKNIIGVMSGKGGVGKSTISAMIAEELNSKGYSVGLMDADVTGPSIPRLLNISNERAFANEKGLLPVETENGIKVISLNLLMEDENQPVIWRGPLIAGLVEQFWTEVYWGELDYLIIDMPPGTGDVALTVMQSIPLSGIIMVSVPQDLVSMIVSKAINMVKKIKIFESDNIGEFLEENNIKLLGELPMSKDIANISQENKGILDAEIKRTFENIGKSIIESLN